ncbi:MAG: transposase [Pyrinomonadaceae bacterium]
MPLSDPILSVMREFESAFSQPTWHKVQVLLIGTLLARGRRTVTAALRHMGLRDERNFSLYHQVLNRARWRPLELSRRLLHLLVRTFVAVGGELTFVIDETLERRWGRRIKKRGHYRDPLQSSKKRSVSTSGLRWIVLALVITPPWTKQKWALPVMSVLAPTPETSKRLGLRHKTVAERARQMMLAVRRWLPHVEMTLVGDQSYSVVELGNACVKHGVRLVAPLRLDAALYEPAPPRVAGTNGRPRVKGNRLSKLSHVLTDEQTVWQRIRVRWYDSRMRELDVISGTAVWYRIGKPPLPIRWVIIRDPTGELDTRAYFSTGPSDTPCEIVEEMIKRWPVETTFEESRAHLGVETQRQWSDRAIERTTPCLFGLYSLVALLGQALHPSGEIPIRSSAWYPKQEATFADVLAVVRRHLWGGFSYQASARDPNLLEIPRCELNRLAEAVCYSH